MDDAEHAEIIRALHAAVQDAVRSIYRDMDGFVISFVCVAGVAGLDGRNPVVRLSGNASGEEPPIWESMGLLTLGLDEEGWDGESETDADQT